MNKTVKSTVRYLIEAFIVAFGVFLGIYYSNLNAENKTKEDKEKSLSIIIVELEMNQQLLKADIDYHENIKIEIDNIIPNLSDKEMYSSFVKSEFDINGWTGFHFSRLQKTAFESVKTSGIIKEYDIELIQKLSNIYNFQDTYIDFGESILNKAIETNSSTKVIDFIGIVELMTSDLLSVEKQLSIDLEKTVIQLKSAQTSTAN